MAEKEAPKQPSFGISEGTRADLEQYGQTTDPFTGKLLTKESKGEDKGPENKAADSAHSGITRESLKAPEGPKRS